MPIAEDTMQVNEQKSEPSGAVIAADLEIQFFKLFSRFEFALKKAGYLRVRAGRISAHWDKFASDIGVRFFDVVKEIHVADTIIQQPPNKQVVDEGGELGWKACKSPENTVGLFVAIRRIRNNLFHGGKHENPFNDRDQELLSQGIAILRLALETHDMVKWHFDGNA